MKTRDWLALSLLGTSLNTAPARVQGLDDLPGMGSFLACGKTQNAVPDASVFTTNQWPLFAFDLDLKNPTARGRAFQQLLCAWGERIPITGLRDEATQTAMTRFLQGRHIKAEPEGADFPHDGWDALCSVKITAGSKNEAVIALQTFLRSTGYDVPLDGVFTPQMKPLVKAVQEHAGLESFMDTAFGGHYEGPLNTVAVTGDVDAGTWAELLAPGRWPATTVYGGGGGGDVDLQPVLDLLLRAHGCALPPRSSPTQRGAQLQKFERDHGLIADGLLSDALWYALIEPLGANSHGESVRAWQTWHNLFCEARDEVRVTGCFDARARAALRRRGGRITWRDWWDTSNGAAARNAGSLGS